MTEYTMRPVGSLAALMASAAWRFRPRRRGAPRKPPVRHRPQLLSLLLIAYLILGCACTLVHRLG
jgi:hypothetical protein